MAFLKLYIIFLTILGYIFLFHVSKNLDLLSGRVSNVEYYTDSH